MGRTRGAPAFGSWYLVAFMAMLYALSMVDRFLLAVLAQPVSESLAITNTEMGLLMGAGFALLYSIVGVPIAHHADHGNRKRLVLAGVSIWSASTLLSAFANGFEMLLVLRAGVAIGEAVLTPAALSMFADAFDKEKRALPTSAYMSVGNFMASGSFIVGAAALELAQSLEPAWDLEAWRGSFIILGLPGIAIVLLGLFTIREPTRRAPETARDAASGSVSPAVLPFLKRHARVLAPFFLGTGAISAATLGFFSWAPTILQRSFGLDAANASYLFGIIGVPCTIVGTMALPWLAMRINRSGRDDGIVLVLMTCVTIAPLGLIAALVSGSLSVMLGALGAAMLLLPSVTVVTCFAVQTYSPARLRARMVAINLLVVNLFGYTVGPLSVAYFADNWMRGPEGAGYGLAILMAVAAPIALVAYASIRRGFVSLARDGDKAV